MAQALCLFGLLCSGNMNNYDSIEVVQHNNNNIINTGSNNYQQTTYTQYPTTSNLLTSPCPIFEYKINNGQTEGFITLQSQMDSIMLRVELSVAVKLSGFYGKIELAKPREAVVDDIRNGRPILYRVIFPIQNPVPKLTAIYYNDQLICSGPPERGQVVTTMKLEHNLYTGLASTNNRYPIDNRGQQSQPVQPQETYKPQEVYQPEVQHQNNYPQKSTINPYYSPPTTRAPYVRPSTKAPYIRPTQYQRPVTQAPITQAPETQAPTTRAPFTQAVVTQRVTKSQPTKSYAIKGEKGICGKQSVAVVSLIYNGKPSNRGDWPWLVAFYYNQKGNPEFICGGTLYTERHVITAAHCVQNKGDQEPKKPSDALFFIGKHNLKAWSETGYEQSGASDLIVHPDWDVNSDRYDSDIAIVVLTNAVKFSKFINPICLWSKPSTDIRDVEGVMGVVVGWGKTEDDTISYTQPNVVRIPIVNDGECLRSNERFAAITSSRTFCAGDLNGKGPCNGDSGGGLVMHEAGRWFLRGIVSASLNDPVTQKCDLNSYVVFTDAAKFVPWITTTTGT